MFRLRPASALAAGIILVSAIGIQSAAHASATTLMDCNFTVTAAGNGKQILSPNLTPVGTIQTGQVYDLFNVIITYQNIVYWNSLPGGRGDYYPIRTANNSTIYMAKDNSSCTTDSG